MIVGPRPQRGSVSEAAVCDVERHQGWPDVVVRVVDPTDLGVLDWSLRELPLEDPLQVLGHPVLGYEVMMSRVEDLRLNLHDVIDDVTHAVRRIIEAEHGTHLDIAGEPRQSVQHTRCLTAQRASGVVPQQCEVSDLELIEDAASFVIREREQVLDQAWSRGVKQD